MDAEGRDALLARVRLERAIARDEMLSDAEFAIQLVVLHDLIRATHTGPVICPNGRLIKEDPHVDPDRVPEA